MYGWYITVQFMEALFSARAELPNVYLVAFAVGNLALNTLNIIWCVPLSSILYPLPSFPWSSTPLEKRTPGCRTFVVGEQALNGRLIHVFLNSRFYKMIFAVRKRFDKEAQPLTAGSASPPSTTRPASENGNGATN